MNENSQRPQTNLYLVDIAAVSLVDVEALANCFYDKTPEPVPGASPKKAAGAGAKKPKPKAEPAVDAGAGGAAAPAPAAAAPAPAAAAPKKSPKKASPKKAASSGKYSFTCGRCEFTFMRLPSDRGKPCPKCFYDRTPE